MHRCLDDRTLTAYLTGRLTEGETAAIESAMESCSDCRKNCETVERQLARQWQARLSPAKPASDPFRGEPELARIMQQINASSSLRQHPDSAFAETLTLEEPETSTQPASASADDANSAWPTRLSKVAPEEFLLRLRKSRLVTEEQLQRITAAADVGPGASALGATAQASCGLTDWQLEQLARGNTALLLDNGRYELRRQIGQGGMGAVFLARHRLMNREVALKVIDPRKVTDRQLIARFKREVEASSRLQHEHIVQALDVGQHGEVSFLVLEYVHGSNLAVIVRRDGPLPTDQAAAICLQAASGLAYAHSQGVVHRDIKPQNILLSTAGVTKILDMGLARIADECSDDHTSLTQEGAVMGTVDYMPPEQARDTRTADARSDLYSLGATLYYLLAGKPPFAGGTAIDKLTRLATEQPPSLTALRPDCPLELTQLVDRLLAKSPQDRPASAQEVVRALRPFAADRVAGRAVVTAAVLAADEGHQPAASRAPASTPSLVFENPSALSLVRRKAQPIPWKLWAGLGVAAIASVVVLAIIIPQGDPAGSVANPSVPSGANPGVPPEPAAPSQFTVDIGGHWGEGHQDYWIRPGSWLLTMVPSQGDPTLRHRGALSWSPDDLSLATAIGDADVRIWNTSTGTTTFTFKTHTARVLDVVWAPDGRTLASCDLEGYVHVWSAGSQQPLATYRLPFGYPEFQLGLAYTPDGQFLAIAQSDPVAPKLLKWNWKENRVVASWTMAGGLLCFSPSGRFLANWGRKFQSAEDVLTLVDDSTERVLPPLQSGGSTPRPLGFNADNQLLTLSPDKSRLAAWDPASGEQLAELILPADGTVWGISRKEGWVLIQHGDELITAHLSPGAKEFTQSRAAEFLPAQVIPCVSNSLMKGLLYRGAGSGLESSIVSLPQGRRQSTCPVSPASLQPVRGLVSGRYLRLPAGVLDLETGKSWSQFPEVAIVLPDGRLRGVVGSRVLEWPGVDRQNEPFRIVSELEQYQSGEVCHFSADGRSILAVHECGYCRDVESGSVVSKYDVSNTSWGHQTIRDVIAWHAVADSGEAMLRIVRGGEHPLNLDLPLQWDVFALSRLTISNDGRYLAAVTSDGTYLNPGEAKPAWLYDLAADEVTGFRLQTGLLDDYDCLSAAFTPGGSHLYLTNEVWATDSRRRVWTCPERSRIKSTFGQCTQSVAAMNDERRIVITQDNQVQVWDWPANRKLATVYWMPNDQWALANHVTGCWTGTALASQYLRIAGATDTNREPNWLTPAQYEKQTGWTNDSARAGLGAL